MTIQIALRKSKADADAYLLQQVQNRGCFQPKEVPQNELNYFKQLWEDSNCSLEFPLNIINNIYSQPRMTFKLASKIFNDYIVNIKKNINANDYPLETLEDSFKKCYGINWRTQLNLVTKFNTVNSMV